MAGLLTASGGISTTTLTASGDLKYNGTTSLTTQMATLNGYKISGTFSANTTYQTIYTLPTTGIRAFVNACCTTSPYVFLLCFVEWEPSTYPSITQLAWSGTTAPTYPLVAVAPNTCNVGTQTVFMQLSSGSNPSYIQLSLKCMCC